MEQKYSQYIGKDMEEALNFIDDATKAILADGAVEVSTSQWRFAEGVDGAEIYRKLRDGYAALERENAKDSASFRAGEE